MDKEIDANEILPPSPLTPSDVPLNLVALQIPPHARYKAGKARKMLTECPSCGHSFRAERKPSRLALGKWSLWYNGAGVLEIGRDGIGRIGTYRALTGRGCPSMYPYVVVRHAVFHLSGLLRASGFWVEDSNGRRRRANRTDFVPAGAVGRARVAAMLAAAG